MISQPASGLDGDSGRSKLRVEQISCQSGNRKRPLPCSRSVADPGEIETRNFNPVVVERVGDIFDMSKGDLLTPCKQRHSIKVRIVLAYWAVQELGMSATAVGLKLGRS